MNAEETARKAFDDLKGAIADLTEAQDRDTQDRILHDLQDWLTAQIGHTSGRHGGYIVTLEQRVKDEDAMFMTRFLLNIRGVIAVDPIPDDPAMHIAERRALYRMKDAIEAAVFDV